MGPAICLTATTDEMAAIIAIAQGAQGVEDVSEPSALDATKALNAGLTPEEVKAAIEFITVIFQSGTALLMFLKALREEMRARGSAVAVAEAATGQPLGRIDAGTSDEALTRMAPR
jgi:hypothetical protein